MHIALQNQRDNLLAFAGVFDDKLTAIAQEYQLPEHLIRAVCMRHRKLDTSPTYWQGWDWLRANMKDKFHGVIDAVMQAIGQTHRSSALVENFNSDRVGKNPAQLITGKDHPHWLTLLDMGSLPPKQT